MVKLERWFWLGALPLVLGALLFLFGLSRSKLRLPAANSGEIEAKKRPADRPDSANLARLIGTSSCSARGCHGAIEPIRNPEDPEKCWQNEYTGWTHDRHADAYRVLFNDRAQKIAKLLGGKKKAHEDPRCLACHVNPLVVDLSDGSPLAQEEKLFGVGCESCHGSANKWFVPHTSKTWRARSPQEKWDQFQMIPITDVTRRAEACAGCHVGAPPDKEKGLPLRDVNHDLIAAGHPRLNFEFGTFQANMPPHWREGDQRNPKVKAIPQGHLWAVGQVASAEAALNLLIHRAESTTEPRPGFEKPVWPEFAEYDCYACHHSLTQTSPRQQTDRRGRKPGALPWGSWYFALTRPLAGPLPALDALEKKMQEPYPPRAAVAEKAKAALAELKHLHDELSKNHDGDILARQRILDRVRNADLVDPSWDGAEQLYLALFALQPSKALHDLAKERAFPPGFDSPISWPRERSQPFHPRNFLEKLKLVAQGGDK